MKVLTACEFSGVVRDAFAAKGHKAYSCDLVETEADPRRHFIKDAIKIINQYDWDLVIAFPPCTYLCRSGQRWLWKDSRKPHHDAVISKETRNEERWQSMIAAVQFYREIYHACFNHYTVKAFCIENPGFNSYARLFLEDHVPLNQIQFIYPHDFGHNEFKETGLLLSGLPQLKPTQIVEPRRHRIYKIGQSPDQGRERSRFLPGIAAAMADQWGQI